MDYRIAPEVKAIAEDLVFEHHEDLAEEGPHIEYVMVDSTSAKPPNRMFRIRKITGIHAYLAARQKPERFVDRQPDPFVVVEVARFWWDALDAAQKKGMVDHIISHLTHDPENDTWTIKPPEYGEFPEVLERHGFWRPEESFKEFARSVSEQLSLLPDEPRQSEAERAEDENVEVALTFGERTVHTDTRTMNRAARDLENAAGNGAETVIMNGEVVDKQTGEVLQESKA